MLQRTRGIVLRTTAYGDTSLIASVLTEEGGLQQYMVKGARKQGKKGGSQAAMLQPAAILDLVVYHNPLRNLQYIREMQWAHVYAQVYSSISRHAVAMFMIELLTRCMKQPEVNTSLFAWAETNLLQLDEAEAGAAANMPLHFGVELAAQLGFQLQNNYSPSSCWLDLQEGSFVKEPPIHGMYFNRAQSQVIHQLLEHETAVTLYRIKLNRLQRREMIEGMLHFYRFHIADFGEMKTLDVLEAVLA